MVSPYLSWLVRCVAVSFFLGSAWLALDAARSLGAGDFQIYFNATRSFLQGRAVYGVGHAATTLGESWQGHTAFLYPPLVLLILSPLAHLSLETALSIFTLLSIAALGAAIIGLAHLLRSPGNTSFSFETRLYITALSASLYLPVWVGFALGQVHTVILALLVWTLVHHRRHNYLISGIFLSAALWIKIAPLLFIAPLLLLREWKTLLGVCIGVLMLGAAQVLLIPDLSLWREFFDSYFTQSSFTSAGDQIRQLSLLRSLREGAGFSLYAIILTVAALILGCAAFTVQLRENSQNSFVSSISIFTCLMLLISPITWSHHLTWALIPLTLLCSTALARASAWWWTSVAAVYIAISCSDLIIELGRRVSGLHSEPGLWAAYSVNAALVACGLLSYQAGRAGNKAVSGTQPTL